MRDVHGEGGHPWAWKAAQKSGGFCEVQSTRGASAGVLLKGQWKWIDHPLWYRNFHYSEELERGYRAQEDLFSAGILETELRTNENSSWILTGDPQSYAQLS